jgi:hypothetical protein
MDIPALDTLKVSYAMGSALNKERYSRWFAQHPTTTMLANIKKDLSPDSSGVESGFTAYHDGNMTIFEMEDFLNQTVSAYVGKHLFLAEARSNGQITEQKFLEVSEFVSRQTEGLLTTGAKTLLEDGAVLSFNHMSRLAVSLVEGDDQTVSPDPEILKSEATGATAPLVSINSSLVLPNEIRLQAAYPILVENHLLNFSRLYYTNGSSIGMLRLIAAYNTDTVLKADRAFESLKSLHITAVDFMDILIGSTVLYAAQLKFFRHLLVRKEINQEQYDKLAATVKTVETTLLGKSSTNLQSLGVELYFGDNARLEYRAMLNR